MEKVSGLKKLERRLGLNGVIAISIGSMVGSGIFVLPGIAVVQTGPSLWLAYLLASFCILPAAFSKSELATAMPTSGGTYIYIDRTFGPLAGMVAGLGLCLSVLLKSAFALVGFGAYLSVLADVPLIPMAMVLLITITVLNILGVGKVSGAVMFVVVLTLISITGLSVASVFNLNYSNFDNFIPNGHLGLIEATSLVFVAYAGVTKVAAIAGEVKAPEKNLPRGILTSLLLVTVIYCTLNFVLVGQLSLEELSHNLKPVHTLAEKVGGEVVAWIISALAVVIMTSMANTGLLAASRFPFAMGRDHLLPRIFGSLNQRFLTPTVSILISSLIIGCVIIFFDVGKIAKLASIFMLMIYMIENIVVIVLREFRVQWYKPKYMSPFYPWVQIFGIVSGLFLLIAMGVVVIPALISIAVPGVLLFFFYSRKKVRRVGVIGIRGKRSELMLPQQEQESHELPEFNPIFSQRMNTVVALFGDERSPEMVVEMGIALTGQGKLEVAHLCEIPEQTDLDDVSEEPLQIRSLRRRVEVMSVVKETKVKFDSVVSHDLLRSVYDITQGLNCQWLVKEWGGKTTGTFTLNNQIGWLRDHLSCHVAIFRDAGIRYIKSIMVVINPQTDITFVAETAKHLSLVHHAKITFVIYFPNQVSLGTQSDEYKNLFNTIYSRYPQSSLRLVKGKKEVETLLAQTVRYDLLVLGTDSTRSLKDRLFGTQYDQLVDKASCSVVSIQKKRSDL